MQASTAGEGASFLIQYYDQQIQQLEAQLRTLPTQVVEDLVDEQIVRLAAQERGLSVSDEEVQIRIEEQFGYLRNPPTPEPTPITVTTPISETQMPTPTPMTKEAFIERSNQWFSAMREATGFTREDFEELIRNAILREKLEEQLVANVPTTAEQIHARHILVETREEAEAVKQRLEAGESFEALAAEVSVDTSNKDNGGDLGWFARGRMVPEFEEAAFALEPGEISDVVQTSFGFHIIKVEERDPNRELDAYALEEAKQKAIDDWFAAQRETLKVERNWNSSMVPEDKVQPPTGR
ncbi:MAG: peptidylprolyl isomerase [Chloroflexi bacterium]|nr:peptidylprolyl isomerase [Chloroflexota bacterium]